MGLAPDETDDVPDRLKTQLKDCFPVYPAKPVQKEKPEKPTEIIPEGQYNGRKPGIGSIENGKRNFSLQASEKETQSNGS